MDLLHEGANFLLEFHRQCMRRGSGAFRSGAGAKTPRRARAARRGQGNHLPRRLMAETRALTEAAMMSSCVPAPQETWPSGVRMPT